MPYSPSIEQGFRDFLAQNNHPYDGELNINSSKSFERFNCPLGSPKNENSSYFLRVDDKGRPYGFLQCHGGCCGVKKLWKPAINTHSQALSEQEKRAILRDQYQHQRELIGDRIQKEIEAAKHAQALLSQALDHGVDKTPYVLNKHLVAIDGLKKWSEILYVPLRDIEGHILNVERIYPNHEKRPVSGARVNGLFHLFGEINPIGVLQLTEGAATASIVFEATDVPTVCCRNAGNLIKVAQAINLKFPKISLLVCGDDDRFKLEQAKMKASQLRIRAPLKNAGILGATAVADRYQAKLSFPDFSILNKEEFFIAQEKPPSDWHDLFIGLLEKGLNRAAALCKVQQQIEQTTKG